VKLKKKYINLNDTLSHIRLQVAEGIPYAKNNIPQFFNPIDLFYWLKSRITYKSDPPGVELLQSLPTLLKNNFWGKSGLGDCDCFSIAILTMLQTQKMSCKPWIKLAGRDKLNAVHIWPGVDYKGEEIALDLTNRKPNEERPYKFVQKIYFNYL